MRSSGGQRENRNSPNSPQMIRRSSNIKANDAVVVYPSYGQLAPDGRSWRIEVVGTVYEKGSVSRRKRMLVRLMQRVAKVRPSENEREVFESRIRPFVAPTERGKRVCLRVGEHVFPLRKKTRRNGRFVGKVRLPVEVIDEIAQAGLLNDGWLDVRVMGSDGSDRDLGKVHLLDDCGVSVISDIDDTLKVTEVHSRRSLIANTFLREFQAIDGMAERYRQWADDGAAFHYVSSSPWQLFSPLADLFRRAGLPEGTFHLRSFRIREHMLRRLLLVRRQGKAAAIRSILRRFPRRRFVLVGDSGEKDPEIYGAVARKFSDQVQAIFIRQLEHRRLEGDRLRKAFRGVEPDCWATYSDPAELPERLNAVH